MNHGDDNERLLIRRVSDKIIADRLKPERPRGEIGAPMTLVGKGRKLANGV